MDPLSNPLERHLADLADAGRAADQHNAGLAESMRAKAANTPPGQASDREALSGTTTYQGSGGAVDHRDAGPRHTDDGTRIDSASLAPNADQAQEFTSARYDRPRHDQLAAEHARNLLRSGGVAPTHDLGIPKV